MAINLPNDFPETNLLRSERIAVWVEPLFRNQDKRSRICEEIVRSFQWGEF